jgi:hypothetical protein
MGTPRRTNFAVWMWVEIGDRVAIFQVRRRSAKTWQRTFEGDGDGGGGGIRKSRIVCIGRPVVAR